MTTLLAFALFFSSSLSLAEGFQPTNLIFSSGGDQAGSKNASLDFSGMLPSGIELSAGVNASRLKDASDGKELDLIGGRAGILSDPFEFLSLGLETTTWRLAEDVKSFGIDFQINLAPQDWLIHFSGGEEHLKFFHLPPLLFNNGESQVIDKRLQLSIQNSISEFWSWTISYSHHSYDKNLRDYTEGIRVLRMPQSVLLTATGFAKSDLSFSINYSGKLWNLGVLFGRSLSALDEVKTNRAEIFLGRYFFDNWQISTMFGRSLPENSQEDASGNFYGLMSVAYFWR